MPDSELFDGAESLSESDRVNLILQLIARGSDRRFKFHKRRQLFIRPLESKAETPNSNRFC
jgi:hypothetical protein